MDDRKEYRTLKIIPHFIGVAVIVAVFIMIFGNVSVKTGVHSIDGGIELVDPSGSTCEIIYADITELALISLPESYGTCVHGNSSRGYSYGLWENDLWGSYSLCVKDNVKDAILIRQNEGTLVFNYEGSKPTASFYEALQSKLQ